LSNRKDLGMQPMGFTVLMVSHQSPTWGFINSFFTSSPWMNFAERNIGTLGAMVRNCHCAFKVPYQYHNWTQRWCCRQLDLQSLTTSTWDIPKTSPSFSSILGNQSAGLVLHIRVATHSHTKSELKTMEQV
jgi:hypothetical protein